MTYVRDIRDLSDMKNMEIYRLKVWESAMHSSYAETVEIKGDELAKPSLITYQCLQRFRFCMDLTSFSNTMTHRL